MYTSAKKLYQNEEGFEKQACIFVLNNFDSHKGYIKGFLTFRSFINNINVKFFSFINPSELFISPIKAKRKQI